MKESDICYSIMEMFMLYGDIPDVSDMSDIKLYGKYDDTTSPCNLSVKSIIICYDAEVIFVIWRYVYVICDVTLYQQ